jgi:hyperosmotically inducible protein
MIPWLLLCFLVVALMGTTGHAAEDGAGNERAKDPPRSAEPKKKQDADTKLESDKPVAEEKPDKPKTEEPSPKAEEPAKKRAAEPKKKQDTEAKSDSNGKSVAEEKDKPKPEEAAPPKAEEPTKKPVTSLNLAIKLALMADPQLFPLEIEVELDKGKAVLSGTVPDEEEKNKAAEIAGKIEGVEGVVNKLNVSPALRDKLAKKQDETIAHVVRDRLSRSETLKAVGFDVKSENGVVYLSGKTRFQVIALEAAEAARQVPGVRAVDTAGVQLVAKD